MCDKESVDHTDAGCHPACEARMEELKVENASLNRQDAMRDTVEIKMNNKKSTWSKADILTMFDELIIEASDCNLTDASIELAQATTGAYIDALLKREAMKK